MTEAKKKQSTRIYEIGVEITATRADGGKVQNTKVFLVDAKSEAAAFRHVASKYVGKPTIPTAKRIAELMTSERDPVTEVETVEDGA